ncbi:DUF5053 domain-containing protein [Bacteroides sp.]
MDVQKELEKWKAEFIAAETPEAQADHKKRFKAFLDSLSTEDKKAFAVAFEKGAIKSIGDAEEVIKAVEVRKKLDRVLDFASMSYIARTYFGKTRHWLYQRINGNLVNGKPVDFTPEELNTLSIALSELGDIMKDTSRSIARP